MGLVREFEEKAAKLGRSINNKDAQKYSKELSLSLELIHTNPIGHTEDEEVIGTNKIGRWIRRAMESKSYEELKQEKWQGKFLKQRWDDENLDNDCFQWMTEWKAAPTHTIADLQDYINSSFRPKLIIRERRESLPPQTLSVRCVERCQRQSNT